MTRFLTALLLVTGMTSQTAAMDWSIDYSNSDIEITGQHVGRDFVLEFQDYTVDLAFDPAAPADARVRVVLDLTTAETGNALYDGTLPNSEWLDTKAYPQVIFTGNGFTKVGESYQVTGQFELKGGTYPITYTFNLAQDSAVYVATAVVPLDRIDLGIGVEPDPSGQWVSRTLTLTFKLTATPGN